jgi:hypothetical protein
MFTLRECQANGDSFLLGCACGWQAQMEARSVCRAFAGEHVEALQRMGWFRCACGARPALMVYTGFAGTGRRQAERWTW